ncbi:MAG: InlB B-repeat-containing protein [Clostridia bacterium]|nr:InlB B-repeat-containing protein [Clostridia bacterium]
MQFYERLKQLRKNANLTQNEFSERVGVHFQTVSKWERGASEPDISLLGIISGVLSVSVETLLGVDQGEQVFTGDFNAEKMGISIAEQRKKQGLNQNELAEKLSVSADIISKWERGVTSPDRASLTSLSSLLSVPLSKLYFGVLDDAEVINYATEKKRKNPFWQILAVTCACVLVVCLSVFIPIITNLTQNNSVETVEPVVYTVDFWVNGGQIEGEYESEFTGVGDEISLPTPRKEEDVFVGWYLNSDYSGDSVSSVTCDGKSVSVYAKWQSGECGIRYELGGGTCDGNPTVTNGSDVITLNDAKRNSHIFLGWYTEKNGGEKYEYVGGDHSKNITLYARWQKVEQTFSVTYTYNGGNLEKSNPSSLSYGEVYILNPAQKVGHKFLGWYDDANGEGKAYEWIEGNADLHLYALFEPICYVISYEYDGVYKNESNPSFVTYGEEVELSDVIFEGHNFVGWFTSEEGGQKIERITPENVTSLTTLYARYEPKTYTVTLFANGGIVDEKEVETCYLTYTYGTVLPLPVALKDEYTFECWVDEDGREFSEMTVYAYGDLVLTARYYRTDGTKIIYEKEGGEPTADLPEKIIHGTRQSLCSLTKEGFIFLGWNDKKDGSGEFYTLTPVSDAEQFTLYAIWQEILTNGSSEHFDFVKGATTVTVTKYKGQTGEHIDVVIPSYIEELPVSKIGDGQSAYSIFGEENVKLNSLTLPLTLRTIECNALSNIELTQTLIIPATTIEIKANAFANSFLAVEFAENSELKALTKNAFYSAKIKNVFVIPDSVDVIEGFSLSTSCMGVKLPNKPIRIASFAFYDEDNGAHTVYFPDNIDFDLIEENAFYKNGSNSVNYCVYSKKVISEELKRKWGAYETHIVASGVTLVDGDSVTTLDGNEFILPTPQKEGYRFLGWQKPNGAIAGQYYVAKENNLTLTALYESNNDFLGSDKTSPITLNVGDSVEIDLVLAQNVHFFIPDQGMAYQVKVIPLNDYTNVDGSCSGCFSYPVDTALSLIDFATQVTNWYTDFTPTLFCIEEGDQNFAIRRVRNTCGIAYSLRYKVSVTPYTQ